MMQPHHEAGLRMEVQLVQSTLRPIAGLHRVMLGGKLEERVQLKARRTAQEVFDRHASGRDVAGC